jgi:GcrA cell cycle regulator
MTMWDESAVATLRQRWIAGETAGTIAAELGFSRSAVIAKAARLGLPRHQSRPSVLKLRIRPQAGP